MPNPHHAAQTHSIDPNAVEIGDTLRTQESNHIAFGVTDVDRANERVKVYTPTTRNTIHRWKDMSEFAVHKQNDDLHTDADRTEWLNNTLPTSTRHTADGEKIELEYVITDDGVEQQPVDD